MELLREAAEALDVSEDLLARQSLRVYLEKELRHHGSRHSEGRLQVRGEIGV